jgi:hypothetical protein
MLTEAFVRVQYAARHDVRLIGSLSRWRSLEILRTSFRLFLEKASRLFIVDTG